jgi:hypothetical protein
MPIDPVRGKPTLLKRQSVMRPDNYASTAAALPFLVAGQQGQTLAQGCNRLAASHINITASRFCSVVSTFGPEPPEASPYAKWLLRGTS